MQNNNVILAYQDIVRGVNHNLHIIVRNLIEVNFINESIYALNRLNVG